MPKENEAKPHKTYYKASDFEKGIIIGRHKEGRSTRDISREEGIPQSTVSRIILKFEKEGTYKDKKHPRPPKKLTPRALRYLKLCAKKDRHMTLAKITRDVEELHDISISQSTVRKYLHDLDLHSCIAVSKPLLDKEHNQKGGKQHVWREPNEKYDDDCLVPKVQGYGGSVSVWGCIWAGGVGPLVILDGNMTKERYVATLREHYLPFIYGLSDIDTTDYILQEDNATPHKSKLAVEWKEENDVAVLPWPAKSPDLNPIENIWSHLDNRVRDRRPLPTTLSQLEAALVEEWANISHETCMKYCLSIKNRVSEVRKKRGGHIPY